MAIIATGIVLIVGIMGIAYILGPFFDALQPREKPVKRKPPKRKMTWVEAEAELKRRDAAKAAARKKSFEEYQAKRAAKKAKK